MRTGPLEIEHRFAFPPRLAMCPCQMGPSAGCLVGRHNLCPAEMIEYPETWITDAAGCLWGPDYDLLQVWLADRVCRWQCTCTCHRREQA